MYGGIHIDVDNKDGFTLGKRIGATVVTSLSSLSPANYKTKGGARERPEPTVMHADVLAEQSTWRPSMYMGVPTTANGR